MRIETTQLLFVQWMLNRSSDLSDRIKLAKFRLFIYSKLEPKISKIYRNSYISGKPRVWELTRCVYFRNTANTSEIITLLHKLHFQDWTDCSISVASPTNISMWRNGFFKNHQTTGFMPPKTVLLRTPNLPWGYANHALLYRPMPYVFYC